MMYPSPARLQALVEALLEVGGFEVGRELQQAEALWESVDRAARRSHPPFDGIWFSNLLDSLRLASSTRQHRSSELSPTVIDYSSGAAEERVDWGDAPALVDFVGRVREVDIVRDWMVRDGCRLISVLGLGGIGKTAFCREGGAGC
jgi:hypothetical protein